MPLLGCHWSRRKLAYQKLSGYAADYQIKDVDNDGEDEIVIALVTSSASIISRNSVIVAYKLSSSE